MGHGVGDELLRIAARRLAGCLPETAVLARPGGDEFVALLADAGATQLDAASAAVCRSLGENFALRGHDIALGASVGIAVFPHDGASADELLRHADMAMYAAKQRGRGRAARFEAALHDAAMRHAQVLRDLRQAVPRGELVLHYQPRVEAATGRARSVEALVRWNHPARGLLSPAVFIDVAEETGLIVEIGRWVLQEACRQMALWRRQGVQLDHVAVNVSVGQLRSPALASDVESALRLHGLTPAELEIEVTESVMVGDPEAAAGLLRRLAATGVRIALDDFGTGYSSMSYLRQLPIDVIKVDRAFVRDLGVEPSADAVARAIVALATSLDMSLVAEGVETEAQAALLRAMGCQELQGFLYARPLPPDEVAALPFVGVRPAASDRDVEVLA
jgi:predicted signal transduction protein with EAL and GGDEF domain